MAPQAFAAPGAPVPSGGDLDLIARTMIGEDPSPEGQAAVAHVIYNRLGSPDFPATIPGIINPGAFESWQRQDLNEIPVSSLAYQQAYRIAANAWSSPDPTHGAVHFLNPQLQKQLGRQIPSWAAGTPSAVIGSQAYFRGTGMDNVPDYLTHFAQETPGAASPQAPGMPPPGAPGSDVPDYLTHFAQGAPSAPAPMASASSPTWAQLGLAATSGVVGGMPVVGPPLLAGSNAIAAAARAYWRGTSYSSELRKLQDEQTAAQAAYPATTTAAGIGGAVLATAPLAAAAPAAFGLGEGVSPLIGALRAGSTGAGIGGANALANEMMPWLSGRQPLGQSIESEGGLPRIIQESLIQGGIGSILGAGAPIAGNALKSAAGWLQGATAPGSAIMNILQREGITAPEAAARVNALGPQGMLTDISPTLRSTAASLAAMPGEQSSIVTGLMAERASTADTRFMQQIDNLLGPRLDFDDAKAAIKTDAKEAAAPFYAKAYASPQVMDISPVLDSIDSQLKAGATGGVGNVLNTARSFLLWPDGTAKTDVAALHYARQALDDYIYKLPVAETSAGENAQAALYKVRGGVDQALKANPDMAAGDNAFSNIMKRQDALAAGIDIFSRDVPAEAFAKNAAAASPEELQALQTGARIAIGAPLEDARRGALSEAQSMFGKSSANRAKLVAAFPETGDEALSALQNQQAMRASEQKILAGSKTAETLAGMAPFQPSPSSFNNALMTMAPEALGGILLGNPIAGAAAGGATLLAKNMAQALTAERMQNLAAGTARLLTARGPQLANALSQLQAASRAQSQGNALAKARYALPLLTGPFAGLFEPRPGSLSPALQ